MMLNHTERDTILLFVEEADDVLRVKFHKVLTFQTYGSDIEPDIHTEEIDDTEWCIV